MFVLRCAWTADFIFVLPLLIVICPSLAIFRRFFLVRHGISQKNFNVILLWSSDFSMTQLAMYDVDKNSILYGSRWNYMSTKSHAISMKYRNVACFCWRDNLIRYSSTLVFSLLFKFTFVGIIIYAYHLTWCDIIRLFLELTLLLFHFSLS